MGFNILENGTLTKYIPEEGVTKVTIPEGVKVIGEGAFKGCTEIAEVIIPEWVDQISKDAFEGCSSLKRVEIRCRSKRAFCDYKGCTALEEVTYPEGYINTCINADQFIDTKLYKSFEGEYLTLGCMLLEYRGNDDAVRIPEGVKMIGEYCVSDKDMKTLFIPKSVEIVMTEAFYGCDSLVKVEFESEKVTLCSGAFTNCWGLKEIAAPTGLYGVESDSFEDCPNLDQRAIPGLLDI